MNQKIKTQKGFIKITILVGLLAFVIVAIVGTFGAIKYKEEIKSGVASIFSAIFKSKKEASEKPPIEEPVTETPPIPVTETSSTAEIIKELEKEIEAPKKQPEREKMIEEPNYTQPKKDNETILLEYKVDTQNIGDLAEGLLSIIMNSPDKSCPSIIETKTTRKHIYFMYLDNLMLLKSKYDKYRDAIEYIDNNLSGWEGVIQMVKNECASLGYHVD